MTIKNPGGPAHAQGTRLDRVVVACRCCPGGVSRSSRVRRYPSDMSDAEVDEVLTAIAAVHETLPGG